MLVAMYTTFAASRKEPLVERIARIHDGFLAAGFGEPSVRFTLADAPVNPETSAVTAALGIKRISSVDRVRKRWPQLERFARERMIANITESGATEAVDFALLLEIARGVPRSFPFHALAMHFSAPGFSDGPELPPFPDGPTLGILMRAGVDIGAGHPTSPGVNVKDSWWVNGRNRYVAAMRIVEADPTEKKLPAPPPEIATLFAACGKVRKTVQFRWSPRRRRNDPTLPPKRAGRRNARRSVRWCASIAPRYPKCSKYFRTICPICWEKRGPSRPSKRPGRRNLSSFAPSSQWATIAVVRRVHSRCAAARPET